MNTKKIEHPRLEIEVTPNGVWLKSKDKRAKREVFVCKWFIEEIAHQMAELQPK